MERCVSGPGVHGKLQSRVCWRAIRQTSDVTENGVTDGERLYGAEDTWKIGTVGYSPVGDEIIPSNTKNASLRCHVECL